MPDKKVCQIYKSGKTAKKKETHQSGADLSRLEPIKGKAEGKSLTPKQEKFALCVAQGMTQAGAYRAAYDAENMKPETVQEEASKLMAFPKVSTRVEEHRAAIGARMAEEITYDYVDAMKEFEQVRTRALELDKLADANTAIANKAKMSGLMVEDRKNDRNPVTGLDHVQVKAALEALAAIKKAKQAA